MSFLCAYVACIVLFLYTTRPNTLRFLFLNPRAEATSCFSKSAVFWAARNKCPNLSLRSVLVKAESRYKGLAKHLCIWNVPYLSTLRVPIVRVKEMHEVAFLILVIARQGQRLTAFLCIVGFTAAADVAR